MKSAAVKVVIPLAVVVLGGLISAYLIGTRPEAAPNPPTEKIRPVRVVPPTLRSIQPEFIVYGEIASGREAEIRPMVAGRLVSLAAEYRSGAFVHAGSELAKIDPFDYEIAVREQRADLAEAEARVAELRAELITERRLAELLDEQTVLRERDTERVRNLAKKSQTSEKAFDDAKLALNTARQASLQGRQAIDSLAARIEQQEATVDRTQARLARATRNLADTTITAPYTGFLQGVDAAVGKRVAVGERIAKLIDAEDLEARFEIANADYSRLVGSSALASRKDAHHPLTGTEVNVAWRLGKTTYTYSASIERVGAEIDSSSGGVVAYARVSGGPIELLRPGAFVEVSVPDITYQDIIVLPETAVSDDGIIYYVEESRLVAREVEIVREFGDRVFVRAEIDPDSQIVAEQFPDIGPGIHVQAM